MQKQKGEYIFSGTMGDAFVAMCKLSSIASREKPQRLRRMCTHAGYDGKIKELSKLFNGIVYNQDFINCQSIDEMRTVAFANRGRYINIFFDGDGREGEPDDPLNLQYNAYPSLDLQKLDLDSGKKYIGLQLSSGTDASGLRNIDLQWAEEFIRCVTDKKTEVLLLGMSGTYARNDLDALQQASPYVTNYLDNSFTEWLSCLSSVDYLITPEGLASFFALSQKVPSLVMYEQSDAVLRMAKEWRRHSVCVQPNVKVDPQDNKTWFPFSPEQTASVVLSNIEPDRC